MLPTEIEKCKTFAFHWHFLRIFRNLWFTFSKQSCFVFSLKSLLTVTPVMSCFNLWVSKCIFRECGVQKSLNKGMKINIFRFQMKSRHKTFSWIKPSNLWSPSAEENEKILHLKILSSEEKHQHSCKTCVRYISIPNPLYPFPLDESSLKDSVLKIIAQLPKKHSVLLEKPK